MKKIPYTTAMNEVQTGDGIFTVGKGLLANAILKFTNLSHVGVVVRFTDIMPHYHRESVQIVESVKEGLITNVFIDRVRNTTLDGCKMFWLPIHLTTEQRSLIREYALSEIPLHRKYGTSKLIANAFGYQTIGTTDSRICSEWHAAALVSCGCVDWQVAPKPGDIPNWLGSRCDNLMEIIGPKENEAV